MRKKLMAMLAVLAFPTTMLAIPCLFPVNGGPAGTLSCTTGSLGAADATINITDMIGSLSVTFTTTKIGGWNDTVSYTGGNWNFSFTAKYISGNFTDDYSIDGNAQHVKKADAADLNNAGGLEAYSLFIASGPVANGGNATDGPKNHTKAHAPHQDLYEENLSGRVNGAVFKNLNPVTFTLTGEHNSSTTTTVPEPAQWGPVVLAGMALALAGGRKQRIH